MKDLTLNDLAAPLLALRTIAAEHPGLPTTAIQVTSIYPDRLEISLHDDLGAFEAWREALAITPAAVTCGEQGGGTTLVLKADTEYAGASIYLVGYAPLLHHATQAVAS